MKHPLARRFSTLAVLSTLAACGGQDAPMDDMNMDETPQPAAAPAAEASGSSCPAPGATALTFSIGAINVLLCYGAPSVGGRQIMGGVVPYGQLWQMGAEAPTTLQVSAPVNVGGISLEPGSYSLYAMPGADRWELFVNSNAELGTSIDAGARSTEVGSFAVTPLRLPDTVEQLRYVWEPAAGGDPGGELLLEWENTALAIPIEG